MPPWQGWVLGALVLLGAFSIFPFACDGEYVLFDPVWYAGATERYDTNAVKSHHMLFHLGAMGIARVAELAGAEDPGRVAVRTLSGLGAAAILLILVSLVGAGRWRVGAALFLLLLATRTFFLEAFLGENVLPAVAVGLIAMITAVRSRSSLRTVGVWTVLALLWRQDSILLLPAISLGLWWRLPGATRARQLLRWLAVCGGVTVALYGLVGFTLDTGTDLDGRGGLDRFQGWMWGVAKDDYAPGDNDVARHAATYGVSVIGRQWPPYESELHSWVGVLFLSLLIGYGVWFRGTAGWHRLAVLVAMTAVLRFVFFAWFEPTNPEWALLTWVLVAAVAATAVRGAPQTRPATRVFAGMLVALALLAIWRSHASTTLSLRGHEYDNAAAKVAEHYRKGYRVYGWQNRSCLAVSSRGIPVLPLDTDFDKSK